MNAWDMPMYSSAMASRLVDLSPWRVRRWLMGYDYKMDESYYHVGSVVRSSDDKSTYASFLELIDLLFIKNFIEYGLSLQKIRKALREAESILENNHFAERKFFTDGKKIYLQVKNNAEDLLELLSGGQWVIAPIIKQLADQIDFHNLTGLAQRWHPLGQSGLIVLDPNISFGQPTVVGHGITTSNIHDMYMGESERITRVCSWFNLNKKEVKAAVYFEKNLVAA